jgi:hypothetical protein
MLERFTSRKFLLTVVTFAFAVLSTQGVIPASDVEKDIAIAAPLVYLLVEGVLDALAIKHTAVEAAALGGQG